MQFSVPQFTDVEDRIVAGLTFKQFGIVFLAGVLVFVVFTISKSVIATIVLGVILGFPALVVAFGRVNGRPIYAAFGPLMGYLTGGRLYVFHKQAKSLPQDREAAIEVREIKVPALDAVSAVIQLKKLNYILQQQASQEQVLLGRIATSRLEQESRK